MACSRRELFLALSAAVAVPGFAGEKTSLPSKAFRFEDLKVSTENGNSFRSILQGVTHAGCPIEVHESALQPGGMPHPPHHHVHEEMFLIREGMVEVTIAGQSSQLGPGSAAFVASNEEHSIRNVGANPAQYFVLALGQEK